MPGDRNVAGPYALRQSWQIANGCGMGIYDRDWMRRRDEDSSSASRPLTKRQLPTPRTIMVQGVIFAVLIIVGLYFSGGILKKSLKEPEPVFGELDSIPPIPSEAIPEPEEEAPPKPLSPVNVNEASLEELRRIPDMRENVALAIIRMRPYEKLEDLTRVPGIKEKRLELLRPYLTTKAP